MEQPDIPGVRRLRTSREGAGYGISALGRGGPDLMVDPARLESLLARIKDEVRELEDLASIGRSALLTDRRSRS
jgi:hypothetical protein